MDFRKVFHTVQRARIMQWPIALGVPIDMEGGIYALYEFVSRKLQLPIVLTEDNPLSDTFDTHRRIDSLVGPLIWTYIYPMCCVV